MIAIDLRYQHRRTEFATEPAIPPKIDVNEENTGLAWGAKASMEMNLDEIDQAPMFALNEIIWKSVKGADSEMPLPVHRYSFQKR